MTIIVSKGGKDSQKLETTDFPNEDFLEKYISDNPESIPLYDIKENVKLLIIARQFPTTSGPIDSLGIDQDGQLYIVETKLYKNPDKRKVVAQVLDYGASLWKNFGDFDEFIKKIDSITETNFHISFEQRLKEFFEIDDETIHIIFENMNSNIREGNVKFVVLMDKLSRDLKDLITFVNQNSNFTIYPVELEFYKFDDYEIMIPKIFGADVRKTTRSFERAGPRDEQYHFDKCDQTAKTLYLKLKEQVCQFGDDVKVIPLKIYIAFKRNTNFIDVQFQKSNIVVYVNMKMNTLKDTELQEIWESLVQKEIGRDVTNINHNGNGEYEFSIYEEDGIEDVVKIAKKSYELN